MRIGVRKTRHFG